MNTHKEPTDKDVQQAMDKLDAVWKDLLQGLFIDKNTDVHEVVDTLQEELDAVFEEWEGEDE